MPFGLGYGVRWHAGAVVGTDFGLVDAVACFRLVSALD